VNGCAALARDLSGPLYKVGRQSIEVELPKHAFAVIPISDIL